MRKLLLVCSVLAVLALAGCYAGVVATRPPDVTYARPVRPGKEWVWTSGDWIWSGGKYHWREGRWQQARQGYAWKSGYWEKVHDGYRWKKGRWQ